MKNKWSLRQDMWDIKCTTNTEKEPQKKSEKKGQKKYLQKIIAEQFPNLRKDMNFHN